MKKKVDKLQDPFSCSKCGKFFGDIKNIKVEWFEGTSFHVHVMCPPKDLSTEDFNSGIQSLKRGRK